MTAKSSHHPLRQILVLAIVVVLTMSPVMGVIGTPVVGTASANQGVHYVTDSGFEIEDQSGGADPRSGNPFTDSDTLALPDITLSASGNAYVTINQRTGTYTKLSNIDDNPSVTVNPSDKQTVVLNGGFDSIDFSDVNYDSSNTDTDLTYTAGNDASIEFKSSGLSSGETVNAVDVDTDTQLDSTTVDSDKSVSFTALDSGTHNVNLKTESSSGGGGGGGGGGGSSGSSSDDSDDEDENAVETTVTVNQGGSNQTADGDSETDMKVNISNPQPGQTLVIDEGNATIYGENESAPVNETPQNTTDESDTGEESSASNVRANQVTVEINTEQDFTLSVTTYEDDLNRSSAIATDSQTRSMKPLASGTPMVSFPKATDSITQPTAPEEVSAAAESFENQTNTIPAGYVQINTTLKPEEISNASLAFSIRQSYLENLDVDAENVTLYHQVNSSEWETRDTEYLGNDSTYHRFEGTMTEFSVFALGTGASQIEVVNASLAGPIPAVNETGSINASVENRGQTTSEKRVELAINDDIVDSTNITLDGGETDSVNLSFTPNSVGDYNVSVGSVELEMFNVEAASEEATKTTTATTESPDTPTETTTQEAVVTTIAGDETTVVTTTTEESGDSSFPVWPLLIIALIVGGILAYRQFG